jgi:hypothetical protein
MAIDAQIMDQKRIIADKYEDDNQQMQGFVSRRSVKIWSSSHSV